MKRDFRRVVLPVLAALLCPGCLAISPGPRESSVSTGAEAVGPAPAAAESGLDPRERARALAAEAAPLAGYSRGEEEIRRAYVLAREAYALSDEHALLLARAALLASHLTGDPKQKAAWAEPGLEAAISAEKLPDVDPAEAAYYRGVHFGLVLQAKGLAAVNQLPEMVAILERAMAAPGTDHGGPRRALGMLYLRAPTWPSGVGDLDRALEILEELVREHPGFPINQYAFAEALLEDGRTQEASLRLTQAEEALENGSWGAVAPFWKREIDSLRDRIR